MKCLYTCLHHLQTRYISAQRTRSFIRNEIRKANEDESGEFIGIINYSIMVLIHQNSSCWTAWLREIPKATAPSYDAKIQLTKELMEAKTMIMERLLEGNASTL
jgi:hypothetical protein